MNKNRAATSINFVHLHMEYRKVSYIYTVTITKLFNFELPR